MEGEALVTHGAAMTLQEKLMDNADEIELLVCSNCGVPAVEDKIRNKHYCPLCKSTQVYKIKTSYGFKILLYEMISMGVYPKINIGDKIE
jgi:DNA-directed RNA polymerase subunit B'/DNA-directed RNA polymerase subunit B